MCAPHPAGPAHAAAAPTRSHRAAPHAQVRKRPPLTASGSGTSAHAWSRRCDRREQRRPRGRARPSSPGRPCRRHASAMMWSRGRLCGRWSCFRHATCRFAGRKPCRRRGTRCARRRWKPHGPRCCVREPRRGSGRGPRLSLPPCPSVPSSGRGQRVLTRRLVPSQVLSQGRPSGPSAVPAHRARLCVALAVPFDTVSPYDHQRRCALRGRLDEGGSFQAKLT